MQRSRGHCRTVSAEERWLRPRGRQTPAADQLAPRQGGRRVKQRGYCSSRCRSGSRGSRQPAAVGYVRCRAPCAPAKPGLSLQQRHCRPHAAAALLTRLRPAAPPERSASGLPAPLSSTPSSSSTALSSLGSRRSPLTICPRIIHHLHALAHGPRQRAGAGAGSSCPATRRRPWRGHRCPGGPARGWGMAQGPLCHSWRRHVCAPP